MKIAYKFSLLIMASVFFALAGAFLVVQVVRAETSDSLYEIEKAQMEIEKKDIEFNREINKDLGELERESAKTLSESNKEDSSVESESEDWEDELEIDDLDLDIENLDKEAKDHRSEVSSFVKSLLRIASSTEKGLGDEVRKVAKEQNDDRDSTVEAVDKVKSRNALVTLLIGADYKNLGELRSSIAKMENHINQLDNIKKKTSGDVAIELDAEIKNLTAEKERLANIVKDNENKVSLFGWLAKLLQ